MKMSQKSIPTHSPPLNFGRHLYTTFDELLLCFLDLDKFEISRHRDQTQNQNILSIINF